MYLPLARSLILALLAVALLLGACAPTVAPPAPTVVVAASPAATALPITIPTAVSTATSTSTTVPATATPSSTPAPTKFPGDAANGQSLFDELPCSSCHDDTHPLPGGVVCPNLGNIAAEAARIVKSPDYHGKATDAAGYIRESILNPNAYIVPGANYHTPDGQSAMEKDFAQTLTQSQIDDLVAYLLTKQ